MAINLTSNFDQQAAMPLDSRLNFDTTTLRDALAAGRRYEGMLVYTKDTGKYWILDSDLTTWIDFLASSGNNPLMSGNAAPSMLTVVPLTDPSQYTDYKDFATNGYVRNWHYNSTMANWYPEGINFKAKHIIEDMEVSEAIIKNINKQISEALSLTESITKSTSKNVNEILNITEALIKNSNKIINENIDISENIVIHFNNSRALNGRAINTGALN